MKGLGFGSIGGVLLWSRALGKVGAPGRNRTCDNQLRRLGLSPTELRARLIWSGREDLNLRRPAPKAGALPGCATPRHENPDTSSSPHSSFSVPRSAFSESRGPSRVPGLGG